MENYSNTIIEKHAEPYISLFKEIYPDKDIKDKSYSVTIIRWLIMYFLYQEKRINQNRDINVTYISIFFELKSHTTVTKAINMVDSYLENKKLLENSDNEYKRKFFLFFYRFQMIFNKKKEVFIEIN